MDTKLDFSNTSSREGFMSDFRSSIAKRTNVEGVIKGAQLNREGLLMIATNDSFNQGEATTRLFVCSKVGSVFFMGEQGVKTHRIDIIRAAEERFSIQISHVLGLIIEGGGVTKLPIPEYSHRALEVGSYLRGSGCAQLLHDTINEATEVWDKEVNQVPSLLHFYIQQGFSIKGIHVKKDVRTEYVSYKITTNRQKSFLLQLIDFCLREGDISLPFMIELERNSNGETEQIPKDIMSIPEHLKKELLTLGGRDKDGFRVSYGHSTEQQRALEQLLGLNSLEDSRQTFSLTASFTVDH